MHLYQKDNKMKNRLLIMLISFIFIIGNLHISYIYAMGNMGSNGGRNNNGNNGGGQGQGGGKANASGNNPKAQTNKNKNKPRISKRQRPDNSRVYRVHEFCKKNKEACGTNRKRIIRTDEEKRLIAIELIEAINRYRANNLKEIIC